MELSRRLARDMHTRVTLQVIGGPSFWSNYTGELAKLDSAVGKYLGTMPHEKILELMSQSDILVVPSRYEPGGIVVAEAAAQGCFPVVSDEVGSAEPLEHDGCERYADAGGVDALEAAVRRAIGRVEHEGLSLRQRVAAEAWERFRLDQQALRLLTALQNVVGLPPLEK